MDELRRIGWRSGDSADALVTREWLLTNGLGGYACGTLGGTLSRRFHGVLVASLGAEHGRTMVMNRLAAQIVFPDGAVVALEGSEPLDGPRLLPEALVEVRFEAGLPVGRHEARGVVLEKRVVMPHARNTTLVAWRVLAAPGPVVLRVWPELHVRPHEGNVGTSSSQPYEASWDGQSLSIDAGDAAPAIALRLDGLPVRAALSPSTTPELLYAEERSRGYDCRGRLFSPGAFEATLAAEQELTATVTVDAADRGARLSVRDALAREHDRRRGLLAKADRRAREGMGGELVLAADAFVISPALRDEPNEPGAGPGDGARTIIAGYHWFTDWGRDTMISLEGLTLLTGRREDAAYILRMFARHVKDGLIPNLFPEGKNEGLYHTADATLWFFHALDRYVDETGDRQMLGALLPTMIDIVEHHVRGTRFGIGVDEADGLLRQGAEGYQLTWMDAKVGDLVVTPRRGKAVEINALFYNALRTLGRWLREEGRPEEAAPLFARADRHRESFNRRFWFEAGGYLYDVVDGPSGDDESLRPNQIFAVSLPSPVLVEARWRRVVDVVEEALLTPRGLRSLGPKEPDYKKSYDGDLHARDAAYHQGTVWGWLIGPFVDARLRVRPGDVAGARRVIEAFAPHLGEACIGSISEIFDAEAPCVPRGCVAQAWSVAETLRAWVRTA